MCRHSSIFDCVLQACLHVNRRRANITDITGIAVFFTKAIEADLSAGEALSEDFVTKLPELTFEKN
jgi:hypothetical protein